MIWTLASLRHVGISAYSTLTNRLLSIPISVIYWLSTCENTGVLHQCNTEASSVVVEVQYVPDIQTLQYTVQYVRCIVVEVPYILLLQTIQNNLYIVDARFCRCNLHGHK